MKTAICYYSRHHGNTLKVLQAMARGREVDLVDVTACTAFDPGRYDAVGFASGIYYGKFHDRVLAFARQYLPQGGRTFFVFTGGAPRAGNDKAMHALAREKGAQVLGTYFCKGYDTFGPFRLVGGVAKGHPDADELRRAEEFYDGLAWAGHRDDGGQI